MADFLNKIREELYRISEIEELNDSLETNEVLDFIYQVPSLRFENDYEIIRAFRNSLYSNKLLSLKSLFYIRDKVNGLGERRIFRVIIKFLAINHTDLLKENIKLIPIYGRWDDLYSLFETPLQNDVIKYFTMQLNIDKNSKTPSTLAKWLKSENASSKETKLLGKKTRILLGLSQKEYRLMLTSLRSKLSVMEVSLSNKTYKNINYDNISISNMLKYHKTLMKNDKDRFLSYLGTLKIPNVNNIVREGEYICPYNLISSIIQDKLNGNREFYLGYWEILITNYINNITSIEDTLIVSGLKSRTLNKNSKSFKIFLTITLLYNELSTNMYKDYFINSKRHPKFIKIKGSSIIEKINNFDLTQEENDFNLMNTMDLLLFTSIKKSLNKDQIPRSILIIIDSLNEENIQNEEILSLIEDKWRLAGYSMPNIKIWNISSEIITTNYRNNIVANYITGYNPFIWEYVLGNKDFTENDLLLKNLWGLNYKRIKI